MTVKPLMRSDVIVKDLHPVQDRAVLCLEGAHNPFSITDFTVQPFHLVIVVRSRKRDLSNVTRHLIESSDERVLRSATLID